MSTVRGTRIWHINDALGGGTIVVKAIFDLILTSLSSLFTLAAAAAMGTFNIRLLH